jgi:hypothetical protein
MIDIPTLDIIVDEDIEGRVKVRDNRGAVPMHRSMTLIIIV